VPVRALLHFAEAGLLAYVAAWFGLLYRQRPAATENGWFALLAASATVATAGTALVVRAHAMADATDGQRLVHVGVVGASGALAGFVARLTGRPSRTLTLAPWVLLVVACLALSGAFFDPGMPAPAYDGSYDATPSARLTPVGVLGLLVTSILLLLVCAELAAAARSDAQLRVPLLATLVPVVFGLFDFGARVLGGPTLHLSSIGILVLIVALSHVLLRRLVEVDLSLERKTRELEAAHERLAAAQEALVRSEQLAAVGELSAVIAHEIRNPLAILKNAATSLSHERIAEMDRETLLTILDQEADRLNRLVNDLLAYASPLVPDAQPVDAVELVQRAADLALESHGAHARLFRVHIVASPPPGSVWGDPALLRHALVNIVDNAVIAMPSGGTITITVRDVERNGRPFVAIAFADEGEGMDTLVRKRARDVFFTTRSTGTGLGLAIVDRVARVHRGHVDIDSHEGQGTTVTIFLPRERGSRPPPPG
jgi:signal transduction histidine kinase